MKLNKINSFIISITTTFLIATMSYGLEQLSETQMDGIAGQFGSSLGGIMEPQSFFEPENIIESSLKMGGITIFTSPILLQNHLDTLRIEPSTGYLQFNNVNTRIELNSTWDFGGMNAPIKIDTVKIHEPDIEFTDYWDGGASSQTYTISNPLDGRTFSRINASEAIIKIDSEIEDVYFNDKILGSFDMNNLEISKIQTELLAIDGTLSASISAAIEIDQIQYMHDTESTIDPSGSITVNGLMIAHKFQVDGVDDILPSYLIDVSPGDPINSNNWTSYGTMKIGTGDKTPILSFQEDDPNITQGAPTATVNPYAYSSIEIKGDYSPYIKHKYTIRTDNVSNMSTIYEEDPDGYIGDGTTYPYAANPRLNKSYLEAKIAFEGSIRARGIEGHVPLDTAENPELWGNASMGIVAADGIRSLTIVEAPGYGYGNDWRLPYDESKYQ